MGKFLLSGLLSGIGKGLEKSGLMYGDYLAQSSLNQQRIDADNLRATRMFDLESTRNKDIATTAFGREKELQTQRLAQESANVQTKAGVDIVTSSMNRDINQQNVNVQTARNAIEKTKIDNDLKVQTEVNKNFRERTVMMGEKGAAIAAAGVSKSQLAIYGAELKEITKSYSRGTRPDGTSYTDQEKEDMLANIVKLHAIVQNPSSGESGSGSGSTSSEQGPFHAMSDDKRGSTLRSIKASILADNKGQSLVDPDHLQDTVVALEDNPKYGKAYAQLYKQSVMDLQREMTSTHPNAKIAPTGSLINNPPVKDTQKPGEFSLFGWTKEVATKNKPASGW